MTQKEIEDWMRCDAEYMEIKPFGKYCIIWVGEKEWYIFWQERFPVPCLAVFEEVVIASHTNQVLFSNTNINVVPPCVVLGKAYKSNNYSRKKLERNARAMAKRKDIDNLFLAQRIK